ncbi:hypothetical protein J1G34_19540 [Pseudomonas sp. Wu6]|uniref:hypothetical protein n=1 Tax=Pseudomonas sp. Wu6 TaxID=1210129 RepID=UPI001CA73168|nr:hypothetical protein [Pseudomonas sp. Wu6]MBY8931235.1 hypothetical protein [Pseudomonas sp. Wu6]
MKTSKLLTFITSFILSINCFASEPNGNYRFSYEANLERINSTHINNEKIEPSFFIVAVDGHSGMLAHHDNSAIIEQYQEGKRTITRVAPQKYGYRLMIAPEPQNPGQFEKEGRINSTVSFDHSVKGQDGKASLRSINKTVSLSLGETVELEWVNEGQKYRLIVKLLGVHPIIQ